MGSKNFLDGNVENATDIFVEVAKLYDGITKPLLPLLIEAEKTRKTGDDEGSAAKFGEWKEKNRDIGLLYGIKQVAMICLATKYRLQEALELHNSLLPFDKVQQGFYFDVQRRWKIIDAKSD